MAYVDGFVLAVPKANKAAYRRMARAAAAVFRDHGATRLVECWGDDVPPGKHTSFPMAVKCRDDEVVLFSWIEWPSKKVRNSGNKKVMADPRIEKMGEQDPPFDPKRMIYGGFNVIVDV